MVIYSVVCRNFMCMLLNGLIFFQDSDLGHDEREKRDLGGKEHSTCLHICSQRNNQVCTNLASSFCGLCSVAAHLTGQTHAWSFGSQPHLHGCLYETISARLDFPLRGLWWATSSIGVWVDPWTPFKSDALVLGMSFPECPPGDNTERTVLVLLQGQRTDSLLPFTTLGFLWEDHFLQISIFWWAIGLSCSTYQSLSLYGRWWSLSVHCERKEVKPSCFWWQTKTWLAYLLYFSCLLFSSSFMGKHPHLKNLQAIKHEVNGSGN